VKQICKAELQSRIVKQNCKANLQSGIAKQNCKADLRIDMIGSLQYDDNAQKPLFMMRRAAIWCLEHHWQEAFHE
jgi:hypothetical protein